LYYTFIMSDMQGWKSALCGHFLRVSNLATFGHLTTDLRVWYLVWKIFTCEQTLVLEVLREKSRLIHRAIQSFSVFVKSDNLKSSRFGCNWDNELKLSELKFIGNCKFLRKFDSNWRLISGTCPMKVMFKTTLCSQIFCISWSRNLNTSEIIKNSQIHRLGTGPIDQKYVDRVQPYFYESFYHFWTLFKRTVKNLGFLKS
jgi:hypothetical protein